MRWFKIFLVLLVSYIFLSQPHGAHAEKIDNFVTDITINKDGTITVSEKIDYDFETEQRHGIYRNIPYIKKNTEGKKFRLELTNILVRDEKGISYQFQKLTENNELNLKIGDPDKTITGLHTYIINYQVKGALTYFSDHDELYWNITGNNWDVPIYNVKVNISLPEKIDEVKINHACFTGYTESSAANCQSTYINGQLASETTQSLASNEGLTVVVGFPKNIVAVLEPKEVVDFWETPIGKIIAVILLIGISIVALFWYVFYPLKIVWKWYKYGRDPKAPIGVASSWYDPPTTRTHRKLTPGETGALVDETADIKDIYATIVDLARRGYIKIIEQKKNDFFLEKQNDWNKDHIEAFEKILLDGIFTKKDTIRLKDADLIKTVQDTKDAIYESLLKERFFPQNPQSIRNFYSVISFLSLFTGNIPLFLISLFFGRAMPAKTDLGAESANIGNSLKNFLTSQERQLEFQAKNQMFFERLLPFAIAFGVEKIWANRFKDLDMKPPSWYQSYNSTSLHSQLFVNSLNSSFSSVARAATPTSSSTGHSSGFSGGSSGGGGGGGGGGSW